MEGEWKGNEKWKGEWTEEKEGQVAREEGEMKGRKKSGRGRRRGKEKRGSGECKGPRDGSDESMVNGELRV